MADLQTELRIDQTRIEPDRTTPLPEEHELKALKGAARSVRDPNVSPKNRPKSEYAEVLVRNDSDKVLVQVRPVRDIAILQSQEKMEANMREVGPADRTAPKSDLITTHDFSGYPGIALLPNIEALLRGKKGTPDLRLGVFDGQNIEFDLSKEQARPDGVVLSPTSALVSISPGRIKPGEELTITSLDSNLAMILEADSKGYFKVSFRGDRALKEANVWFVITDKHGEVRIGVKGRAQGVVKLNLTESGNSVVGKSEKKFEIPPDSKLAFVVDQSLQ